MNFTLYLCVNNSIFPPRVSEIRKQLLDLRHKKRKQLQVILAYFVQLEKEDENGKVEVYISSFIFVLSRQIFYYHFEYPESLRPFVVFRPAPTKWGLTSFRKSVFNLHYNSLSGLE